MNNIYICICTIVLYAYMLADDRFEKMMAQFIVETSVKHNTKPEFFPVDGKKTFWNFTHNACVTFNAMQMYKKNNYIPDTSFVYLKGPIIQAWKMLCSKQDQQDILLTWVVPTDYDHAKPLKIIFYLLVDAHKVEGNTANINIVVDVKGHKECLESYHALQVNTGNFLVQMPDNQGIELYRTQAEIEPHTVKPQDVLLLLFSRAAPIGYVREYEDTLYLHNVTLVYEVL